MKFDVLTLFPGMFQSILSAGVVGRALERGLVECCVTDIRDYTEDKHRNADDYPFGGGAGQLMSVQPIFSAMEALGCARVDINAGCACAAGETKGTETKGTVPFVSSPSSPGDMRDKAGDKGDGSFCLERGSRDRIERRIYMSPRGRHMGEFLAKDLADAERVVVLCGHYEGVDQRAIDAFGFEEVSIGDYILTGGELPAMVLIDAVARLVPGVLGSEASHHEESIYSGLLEYPQYTRPASFAGLDVPEVLMGGYHREIELWNFDRALALTAERRPDLLKDWWAKNIDGLDRQKRKIAKKYERIIRD
ncbi:MAG: tRNA (guanosine(37)-N1)-methyltransferase TrmD [Clostridiales Family XIII bacterium]|nr:tRNA (guanosine(37)-N1)-methyltransferase TrmD [Clostridiales Family XIII bacterium]